MTPSSGDPECTDMGSGAPIIGTLALDLPTPYDILAVVDTDGNVYESSFDIEGKAS